MMTLVWRYKILIRFTMERYDVAVNQDHSKAAFGGLKLEPGSSFK